MTGNSQHGFTLIEVLVAFVIAAIGVAAVYQSFAASLNGGARAGQRLNAVRLAQSKAAALGFEIPLRPGVLVGAPEGGLWWTVEVSALPSEPGAAPQPNAPVLMHATIRVAAGESDAAPLVTLDTVRRQ